MTSSHVLLLAAPGEARERYEERLRALGADYEVVSTLGELHDALSVRAWNGLLLDVPTMIRAGAGEKRRAQELIEFFPVLRLRWDPEAGEVRCLYYASFVPAGSGGYGEPDAPRGPGEDVAARCSLEEFLAREAEAFPARRMRSCVRVSLHLSLSIEGSGRSVRSASLDVSHCGLFAAMAEGFAEGESVRVVFEAAPGQGVEAVVRRVVPWGAEAGMPGLGLELLGDLPGPVAALLAAS